jgi:hypothetical protein
MSSRTFCLRVRISFQRTIADTGRTIETKKIKPSGFLLSHTASRAVPSAPRSLTSEFGMGSGVTSSMSPPETCWGANAPSSTEKRRHALEIWQATRLISTSQLHCLTQLPPLAYQPCSLQGVLRALRLGFAILRLASRLDAFSGYLFRA